MKFTQTVAVAALVGSISAEDAKFKCELEKIEYFKDDKCKEADADANKKAADGLKAYNEAYAKFETKCTKLAD